jgi:hypothetical protein
MNEVRDWACVKDGKVDMVVRWDGVSKWPPSADYLMIDLTEHPQVSSGWDYVDGQFVDNRPEPEDED